MATLAVVLVSLFAAGCGGSAPAAVDDASGDPPPLVAVQTVEEAGWRDTLDLTAELFPWAAVTVAAEAAGRVVELPVEHGDEVRRGDLLARLEATGTAAELERARARLESERVALQQAERDLERGRALAEAEDGILSQDDVERRLLDRDTRAAAVRQAEAEVQVAEERLGDTEIRSPLSGVVSERHVEAGSRVQEGSPVVRILDLRKLKIRASVASADRRLLALEQVAELRLDAESDEVHRAELRFLGREADEATGTFLVEAVTAPSPGLLPGLQGTLTVVLAERRGLLIPSGAVLSSADRQHVFVVEDGIARRREVKIEPVGSRRARVVSGLAAGDVVITQGQFRLADGQAVEVQNP